MPSYNSVLMLLLLVAGASATTLYDSYNIGSTDKHPNFLRFWNWIQQHDVVPKSLEHMTHMFDNWIDNDNFISTTNNKGLSYKLGHNIYSGMNSEEFRDLMQFEANAKFFQPNEIQSVGSNLRTSLPTSVDWRTKGVVTPVKDQGQCGSCYSFSNTGALEGIFALTNGTLESFSEQQIVDCSLISKGGPNMGCNGGQIGATMNWIGKNGGLCTESSYPYSSGTTQSSGKCTACKLVAGSAIKSHVDVQATDNAMMSAIAQQPVSIAVEADQRAFQLYSSGVFTSDCGTNLDHAVLLVGYGTDSSSNQDYYILKNSWGTTWGSQGYMYIGRGSQYNSGKGQCGLLMMGAYPVL